MAYCCHNSLGALAAMPKGNQPHHLLQLGPSWQESHLSLVSCSSAPLGQITHYTGLAGGQALIPQASFTCPHLPTKFCSSQEES